MIGRWGAWVLFVVTLFLTVQSSARAQEPVAEEDSDYMVSPKGRRFRVRFDPASRISFGIADELVRDAQTSVTQTPAFSVTLTYRNHWESGMGSAHLVWQVDHRLLSGLITPAVHPAQGLPAFDAALYSINLLRHDESPSVVLPFSPPVSVPFPFDIGFEGETGRVLVVPFAPQTQRGLIPVPMLRIGVVRAALLLDPWRSGQAGRSFEIGIGVRYDMDTYAQPIPLPSADVVPPFASPRVIHRVAPMTASSLRFRFQTDDGLTMIDLRGDVIPHWTSELTWKLMMLSCARFERTLVAINDQPVAVVLDGGYRLLPSTAELRALHDLRVSLGVTFNLQLK